jgi:hypothetical protein
MVLGWYRASAGPSLDDQVEDLDMLVIMLRSAIEEAERVDIQNSWLLSWLRRIREAAVHGEEVLQSLRRQDTAGGGGEGAAATGNNCSLWNAAASVFRSAKSLLFTGDNSRKRVTGAVTRLQRVHMRIGGFLNQVRSELTRSMPAQQPPAAEDDDDDDDRGNANDDDDVDDDALSRTAANSCVRTTRDGSEVERAAAAAAAPIGTMIRIALMMVTQNFLHVINRLRTAAPAWGLVTPETPDTEKLHVLVNRIRAAVENSDRVEVHGSRWLAMWRRKLQAVADSASQALQQQAAVPACASSGKAQDAGGASTVPTSREELRRTAQSLGTAVAYLDDFLTLVSIAAVAHGFTSDTAIHRSSSSSTSNSSMVPTRSRS